MTYASVDPVIKAWSLAHGLVMSMEFGGHERRFCYTSSPRGECYQISIEPPVGTDITINVWSIETVDNEEMHYDWTVTTDNLLAGLEVAFEKVEELKSRGLRSA